MQLVMWITERLITHYRELTGFGLIRTFFSSLGCTVHRILDCWRDKVTDEEIRKRTEHFLRNWSEKEDCVDHVTRMDEASILKQALQWEVAGFKRRPGRRRINWRDIVNKDLQRMGLTWEEVEASARDRQIWRQLVALCIGDAGWIKSSQLSAVCLIINQSKSHQHIIYMST